MQRQPERLADESFDVLIVGGGITGAGVALDATLRGWRLALIDKGDFAAGTSSVSSKLVHGGLRYLEHGEFRLVHEALHERRVLLHNAPHLVRPLKFILPFYRGFRLPPWKWRLGLALYDLLAGHDNLRRSRPLPLAALRRAAPSLERADLLGGASYFDAQMDDARLCLAVLRTAARHGAAVANYVEARSFEQQGGQVAGVRAVDRVSGKECSIRARVVVNAAGPWVDAVCRLAGETGGPLLQPTKGAHVIVPNRAGIASAFLLLHPRDGRVFFVIPWLAEVHAGEAPGATKLLIGTTDTFGQEAPDSLTVSPDEVAYLLEGCNRYLQPALAPADVLGSFAGLRPLIRARPGEPSSLSREFHIAVGPSGLISVAGGKYTTYRCMAAAVTDAVENRLGRRHRCRTRDCLLDGAPSQSWEEYWPRAVGALRRRGLPESTARHLVQRYGTNADAVADDLARFPELAAPVMPGEPDLQVEWRYQREHEMAVYPADHLLRRSRLGLYRPEVLNSRL
ncbi:MAG: glycerol-3-phosphate dehydrogenase [Planctomycetia bacterium]|nr:glycerol-3-phosphate dehydrogenase [Planctomycetia bacterium]